MAEDFGETREATAREGDGRLPRTGQDRDIEDDSRWIEPCSDATVEAFDEVWGLVSEAEGRRVKLIASGELNAGESGLERGSVEHQEHSNT